MRTPLLRKLIQAARRGQEELQNLEEHPHYEETQLSRRDVLKTGAFLAATALVPTFLTHSPIKASKATTKSIAIVGGGLAGLTAAFRLNQSGINATLYEGNTRLGGRCWSAGKGWGTGFTQDGQYEVGGELVDTIHLNLINLIGELNKNYAQYLHNNIPIELDNMYDVEPTGTHDLYYFNGQPYTYATAISDLTAIIPFAQSDYRKSGFPTTYYRSTSTGEILDKMNLREYIYGAPTKPYHNATLAARAGTLLKPQLQKLLEIAYLTEYGGEIEKQSALNLVYLLGTSSKKSPWLFGESDETYHIRGGNEVVTRTLTNAIKNMGTTIQLGYNLTNISLANNQYTLSFKNGLTATHDIVICAIPFRILRDFLTDEKMISLGFKQQKRDAILNYPMGYNTKHFVQFNSRYWHSKGCNGSTLSDTSTQLTWETTRGQITTGNSIYNGAGILNVYTGDIQAYNVTQQQLNAVTATALNDLDKIMPGIKNTYGNKTAMMPWPVWQFTKGAYSYYAPGNYTRFAGSEIEQEGNMYFCGEHTSLNFQGYLNGAVESGEIAAKRLIQNLTGTTSTV